MEQLGFQWTDFHETLYLRVFRKPIDKIQISLESDKNNWYFQWHTEGRGLGCSTTPLPEIPKFSQSRTGLQIEQKMFSVHIPTS